MIRNFPGPGSTSIPQPLHSHGSWFIVHWHWPQHPRHHRFSLGCTAGNGFLLSAVTEWPPTENCVSSLSLSKVHTILIKKIKCWLIFTGDWFSSKHFFLWGRKRVPLRKEKAHLKLKRPQNAREPNFDSDFKTEAKGQETLWLQLTSLSREGCGIPPIIVKPRRTGRIRSWSSITGSMCMSAATQSSFSRWCSAGCMWRVCLTRPCSTSYKQRSPAAHTVLWSSDWDGLLARDAFEISCLTLHWLWG